jgi:epoxyqueuosine reductase QueG
MADNGIDIKKFEANPALFLEHAIKEYVDISPGNRLTAFGNTPIFDDVLVGFADGDDEIFQDYKKIIGDFHLTPREILNNHLRKNKQPSRITVITWALRFTKEIRRSFDSETVIASIKGNHATWQGHRFAFDQLSAYMLSVVEALGFQAVPIADFFKFIHSPKGRISNWSERHAAYAAGLGTFGHHAQLITPIGSNVFLGNILTDLPLTPSPRAYKDHLAYCLLHQKGTCGKCIQRCPSGALTSEGHNKKLCQDYHDKNLFEIAEQMGRKGYIGIDPTCNFCTMKVPCEHMVPPGVLDKKSKRENT